MTNLFDITLDLAMILGSVYEGTATAADTSTTLIDTNHPQKEDYYNGGTLWFLDGDLANKSARITDYDEANKKYTFEEIDAGKSPADGDRYAVLNAGFPRWLLIQAVNVALSEMGEVGDIDETLTTTASQAEYNLPTGIRNIKRVWVAGQTSEPYCWDKSWVWEEYGDKLVFDDTHVPGSTGYPIRLFYNAAHAALTDDAGAVNGAIPLDWLKWEAAAYALKEMYGDSPSEPAVADMFNQALQEQARLRGKYGNQVRTYVRESRVGSY